MLKLQNQDMSNLTEFRYIRYMQAAQILAYIETTPVHGSQEAKRKRKKS